MRAKFMWRLVGLAGLLVLAGCSQGVTATPTPASGPFAGNYSGILAASEFVVGENRFPFGLASREGQLLEGAVVEVRFYSLDQPEPQFRTRASATWREVLSGSAGEHEHGETTTHLHIRGAYVVDQVQFDRPGYWVAEFDVATPSGHQPRAEGAAFEVKQTTSAPGIGQQVPATRNLTIHDVASFADISTRPVEDEMHNVSVAQAVESGNPFVVVFSSPQFCISAICGPVTDEVGRVHQRFKDRMEFIHIEPWDLTLARNEGRLRPGAEMAEWALPSEPWTFVIDGEGRVAKRFEGLVTESELTAAVEAVLAGGA